jgi:hypothetical protein
MMAIAVMNMALYVKMLRVGHREQGIEGGGRQSSV